jgi:CRISPR-associated protein Cas1
MTTALTVQQLVGAAERLQVRGVMPQKDVDWLALLEGARDRLFITPFKAEVLPAYRKRKGNTSRLIVMVPPIERLLEEALLPLLNQSCAPLITEAVHAYVQGRSTFSAAQRLSQALASGRHQIRQLDIHAYFDHIDRARLGKLLRLRVSPERAALIMALAAAPLRCEGRLIDRPKGLPQGRALSPTLANLYLAPVDATLRALGDGYIRYGDDLLLCANTPQAADQAERRLRQLLTLLDLQVAEEKVQRLVYRGEPLPYLGHRVGADGIFEQVSGARLERIVNKAPVASAPADTRQPNRRHHTLYITENGLYVHVKDGLIILRRGDQELRSVPLRNVDRVLVMSGVAMSSGFLTALVSRGIPMQMFVGRGKAYGSLVSGGLPNPLRLRAQYDLCSDPTRRLALARGIVLAKLRAMQRRLRPVAAARDERERITGFETNLARAADFDALRGVEGIASRVYFEGFAKRLKPPDFAFKGRSRNPPKDPINSLLSFTYSLVFSEMMTALLAAGLDPHPGLLHELRPGHPALASDLLEPYRILVADTFVITLVNTQQVQADGFYAQADKGTYMVKETRRDVLVAFEAFMSRPLGGAKGTLTPRHLLDAAAQSYLQVVLGEADTLTLPLGIDDMDAPPAERMMALPKEGAP